MRIVEPRSRCSTIARDDLLGDVVPRAPVAEEAGDVDQDRVEQPRELLGVAGEVLAVGLVALGADDVHPLLEPPHEGRALVARVVEATGVANELEERLELGIDLGHVTTRAAGGTGSRASLSRIAGISASVAT